jgi:hypothetical protein
MSTGLMPGDDGRWRVSPAPDGRGTPDDAKPPPPHRFRWYWIVLAVALLLNSAVVVMVQGSAQPRVTVPFSPFFPHFEEPPRPVRGMPEYPKEPFSTLRTASVVRDPSTSTAELASAGSPAENRRRCAVAALCFRPRRPQPSQGGFVPSRNAGRPRAVSRPPQRLQRPLRRAPIPSSWSIARLALVATCAHDVGRAERSPMVPLRRGDPARKARTLGRLRGVPRGGIG